MKTGASKKALIVPEESVFQFLSEYLEFFSRLLDVILLLPAGSFFLSPLKNMIKSYRYITIKNVITICLSIRSEHVSSTAAEQKIN